MLDYIVPPQENNALFLMTNFIRTDQEHKRCPGKIRNLLRAKTESHLDIFFSFFQNRQMKKNRRVRTTPIVKQI